MKNERVGTQIYARFMLLTIEIESSGPIVPYVRLIWFTSRKGLIYNINNFDGGTKLLNSTTVPYVPDGTGPFPTKLLETVDTA